MMGKLRLFTLLTLVCIGFHSSRGKPPKFREYFMDQKIDHFNFYLTPYGKETFKQRYLLQDQWWNKEDGPIFLYTGNEGNIEGFWNNSGFVFELAARFNALVVFAEHRFYGQSLPFGAMVSHKQPYVSLLSMEQAITDYAVLLTNLKTEMNCSSLPVIAFGGSYGGMLSAYMRLKYPRLITGSIAASAPVLLVSADAPRNFFFEDVSEDFKNAGCGDEIQHAFRQIKELASQGTSGFEKLSEIFNICKLSHSDQTLRHFFSWLRNVFTVLAMMDYPYPTEFLAQLPAWPVKVACQIMHSQNTCMDNLAKVADMVYPIKPPGTCHDIWLDYVECADPTGCDTGPSSFSWDYQACVDFVMPSGSNNVTDIFPSIPFSLEDRTKYCQNKWKVTPDIEQLKLSYSLKDFAASSNIVFSNGKLDPWHRGGVLRDLSDTVISVMIEEGAHHLDLRATNDADPLSVLKARQIELEHIAQWIKHHKQ